VPITSLTSYFNTSSFGDRNTYTQNQTELALTLDSAAQELSNWKSLVSMSAGGAAFEGGKLAARVLLSSVPPLCAVPLLTNAFTFLAGASADTAFTGFLSRLLEKGAENATETFFEQMTSQGSVRGMGLLGMGQNFVVIQLLQGLASVSQGILCEGNSKNKNSGFLHHLILGLQCHFGSGMFTCLTGGMVNGFEQRLALRSKNMHVETLLTAPTKGIKRFLRNLGPQLQTESGSAFPHSGPLETPRTCFAQTLNPASSGSEVSCNEREIRYQAYVERGVGQIITHIQSGKDRGLVATPLGLRDMAEQVISRLLLGESFREDLKGKEVMLVVQGKENLERWRLRLEKIFGMERSIGHLEKQIWEKNGVLVRLTSIHELIQMPGENLRARMNGSGLIILDQEHHVRPVIDHEGEGERKRFARVLVEGAFLNNDFERTEKEGSYLLGFTETVSEGAGRVYGGREGLVVSDTFTSLRRQGFVALPEVRVLFPKNVPEELDPYEAWANLGLRERVDQTIETIAALEAEGEKRESKIVVYCGTREEAELLANELEKIERYKKKTALLISGDSPQEKRRLEEGKDFFAGLRRIAIHVETMVEGVDEFRRHPQDAVIYSGVERGGGLRYALQSVGAHLVAERENTLIMVDMAGMFLRHPDLMSFDPAVYVLNEGRMKTGSPLIPMRSRSSKNGSEALRGVDELRLDLFGEAVGKLTSRCLKAHAVIFPLAGLAMEMGWSHEMLQDLWEGRHVPSSRLVMERLGEVLGWGEVETRHLLSQWALDRTNYYNHLHPLPSFLSSAEQLIIAAARYGIVLYYGGNVRGVEGTLAETLTAYLERGVVPEVYRGERFREVLARIIGCPHGEARGRALIRKYLGPKSLGEYFKPRTVEELALLDERRVAEWFDVVERENKKRFQEIIWQFFPVRGNQLSAPSPVAVGKAHEGCSSGKVRIRRLSDGNYEVVAAWGQHVSAVVQQLRQHSFFDIRSDGWLGLRALTTEDLQELRKEDIRNWFTEVAQKEGGQPREIIWQFLFVKKGVLNAPKPVLIGKEDEGNKHGRIRIRKLAGEKYEVVAVCGTHASSVVQKLRQHSFFVIRSDGWLGLRPLTTEDLQELRKEDVENWFTEVAQQEGVKPSEIICQMSRITSKRLSRPTASAVGKENSKPDYGKIRIRALEDERYEVVSAWGSNISFMIEPLRQHSFFVIRSDGWLGLRALTIEALQELRKGDVENWFQEVERKEGVRPKEIIWQFFPTRGNELSAPTPVAVGKAREGYRSGKVRIRRLSDGNYEVVAAWGQHVSAVVQQLRQHSFLVFSDALARDPS